MKRLLLILLLAFGQPAFAGLLDDDYLRVGGGFGSVLVGGVSQGSLDLFAGVDTWREGPWRTGFEVSALDVSNSDADGLGVSGFFNWAAAPDVNLFARAGGDFGGDAGWLVGAGVGYFIERNMEVRFETQARQRGNGLFFNLAWYPRLGY
jgi:hypothetical protein